MNNFTKIVIGLFLISFVLNIVLTVNTKNELARLKTEHQTKIEEKDVSIQSLQEQLDELKAEITLLKTESEEDLSNTEIGKQSEFKEAASQFIYAFLEYSVENQGARRENLLKVTRQDIVDILAPEGEDVGDPKFNSEIDSVSFYIEKTDDISKKANVIMDVTYTITGSENGTTTIRNFVKTTLEKQDDGSVIATKYETVFASS